MQWHVLDADVYYEEAGTGRPLLLLHGWPLDHRTLHFWIACGSSMPFLLR